ARSRSAPSTISCLVSFNIMLLVCTIHDLLLLRSIFTFFFFNDTATTEIYTLSLHDALPIFVDLAVDPRDARVWYIATAGGGVWRSEEHTSELQSLRHLVCRLLLEKKKSKTKFTTNTPCSRTRR